MTQGRKGLRRRKGAKTASLLLVASLTIPAQLAAQGVRGTAATTVRYAQIRPIERDSALTFRPGDPQSSVLLSQDVSLTTWGLGVEGLSATFLLRARATLAGDFDWPRYDDPFDAVLAYSELARERYRIRLGRQRNSSGLGFTSFDGLEASFNALPALRVQAYGGRSLGRGLESPRHQALSALEDFLPDEEAVLLGAALEFEPVRQLAGSVRYQNEFYADGSGMLSERASLDLRAARLGPVTAEVAADYDIAFNRLGKAHLTVRYPLSAQQLNFALTARQYRPFFELWTIWGFFSPVGYREAELQAGWRPRPATDFSLMLAARRYEETNADEFLLAAQDDALRVTVRSQLELPGRTGLDAEYRLEHSFGGFLHSAEVGADWPIGERLRLGAYGTAFEQILEFRVGDAILFGFGGDVDAALSTRLHLNAGATLYRQNIRNRPTGADWNQTRAWATVEYRFGRDPGPLGDRQ